MEPNTRSSQCVFTAFLGALQPQAQGRPGSGSAPPPGAPLPGVPPPGVCVNPVLRSPQPCREVPRGSPTRLRARGKGQAGTPLSCLTFDSVRAFRRLKPSEPGKGGKLASRDVAREENKTEPRGPGGGAAGWLGARGGPGRSGPRRRRTPARAPSPAPFPASDPVCVCS